MSRLRYVKGNITEITGGTRKIFAKEGYEVHSNGQIINNAKEGTTHSEPGDPPPTRVLKKYFEEGWWSSDEAGEKRIKEALVGDHVFFHIKTKDIPNGGVVQMKLYDDDNNEKNEPKEKGKKDQDDFKKMINSQTNQEVASGTVKDNKVVKSILLENFESLIKDETDKQIELYYRCSYKTEHVEFPKTPSDYLKVKGMPKIIIVNGQWRLAKYSFGEYVGPTQPKKPYWGNTFSENVEKYFKLNKKYRLNDSEFPIQELEKMNFILYYDGSSYFAGDQSGGDRFANGRKFASENYKEIIQGLGGESIYLVSHSEGGAYAAGMADYLHEKGHTIGEHVLLSPDEGNEFQINPKIPSYQLTYMFFSSVCNPLGTAFKLIKFKRWGSYYAIVDEIVNEHRIKGVTKMGIVRRDDLDWGTVHGSTNSSSIFSSVRDLKEVKSFDVIGEHQKEFYSGKDQNKTTNGTLFYRINDDYIITNCPPISKIK